MTVNQLPPFFLFFSSFFEYEMRCPYTTRAQMSLSLSIEVAACKCCCVQSRRVVPYGMTAAWCAGQTFFFKKIPIGQIEIFFFLFSRSVLIRRRTKNARAYCVLKTRPLFSHSPRKELNPQDGHLILLPFWFTRKWTGENSYESC